MSSVLTVSQLNRYLAFKIKGDNKLRGIAVKGEISEFTLHYRSGHAYFTIKDNDSSVRAVMFSSNASKLKFMPEEGMSVLVSGNAEVYERDGTCQIIASEILPIGAGAAHTARELIRQKLEKAGVFDLSRKKPVPLGAKKIAVVTSPDGAALRDIINITERRYPVCTLMVFPAVVQGFTAAESISAALKRADASAAQIVILARGGGSAEDLAAFDTEKVTMAVAECVTPVISAVGHETDTALADYAADMRAPTPSAAAELATPDMSQLRKLPQLMRKRLDAAMEQRLDQWERELKALSLRIRSASPENRLELSERRCVAYREKLELLMRAKLDRSRLRLERAVSQLTALSPFNVLSRGYSLVEREGELVSAASELCEDEEVTIRFCDSQARAKITEIIPKG